jgi:undecaprenyl pyrophosphate synthase
MGISKHGLWALNIQELTKYSVRTENVQRPRAEV